MKQKLYISISSVLALLVLIGGAFFMFRTTKTEVTIDQYQTELASLVQNIRSGQEQWDLLLGDGTNFQDLCTGFYSARFSTIGEGFIREAETFENLRIQNEDPAEVISNYQHYVSYFASYRSIGEQLIQFAARVDAGEYGAAISILETLISLYDTVPNLY